MAEDQGGQDNPPSAINRIYEISQRRKAAHQPVSNQPDLTRLPDSTSPEEIAAYSAQQLAKTAHEIAEMVKSGQLETSSNDNFHLMKSESGEEFDIHTRSEDVKDSTGEPVSIGFESTTRSTRHIVGVDAKYQLNVGIHNDQESEEAFRKFAQKNPARAMFASTSYFFDENGNFAKVSNIPMEVADRRKPIEDDFITRRPNVSSVFSKMTPSDFELVGKALTTILNRAKPQTPQTPAA